MSASLTSSLVECAPGNAIVLTGSGLSGGSSVVFGNQLIVPTDGTPPSYTGLITVAANYNPTTVGFTVPDGVRTGPLTVTAGDGTHATVPMRVVSQYVQASEYTATEGVDTSDLAAGDLDQIMREASGWVDSYIAAGDYGLRYLQVVEKHKFRPRPKGAPRFWIWRHRRFASLDALVFLTSNVIRTNFNVSQLSGGDIFVNDDLGYLEILAYAFGNYVLLGAIETIGFSANVVEIAYTAGYTYADYPAPIRKATKIIATELLTMRKLQSSGLAPFSKSKHGSQQYDRRIERFEIPAPARDLLRPFISRRLA